MIRLQFSLRDMFAWISFYAILIMVLKPSALRYTLVSTIGALAVGTGFVVGYGLISSALDRWSLRVSYFTCALGVSLEAAMVLLFCFPPLFPFERGPIIAPLMLVSVLAFRYFCHFAALTVISSGAALCCCRTRRAARWLLAANTPGLLVSEWVVVYVLYHVAVAS